MPVQADESVTVWAVLGDLVRHPVHHLIRRWNWKSAATSVVLRGAIFFFANLSAGLQAAMGVLLTEFVFRTLTTGFYGSIIQAFRKAEPGWAAAIATMVILPVCNHTLELLIHWWQGTPKLKTSIIASLCFTFLSTLFNLYAVRRGVLVVGENTKSLREDLREMPRLLASFIAIGPVTLYRYARSTVKERR